MLRLCPFIQIVLFTNLSSIISRVHGFHNFYFALITLMCWSYRNLCSYMQDSPSTHRFAPTYPQSYVSCSYMGMGSSMMGFISGGPFWNGAIYVSTAQQI